jgi:TPR repeat protein
MKAARNGESEKVRDLLEYGADVNAKNENGFTALMFAATLGHAEVVDILIKAGADVNAESSERTTALMGAATTGEAEIARVLIRAGADLNASSTFGDNALRTALDMGRTNVVQALLDAGADVSVVSVEDMIRLGRTLQDDVEAMNWARKAAEQGDPEGQYVLGFALCCKTPSTASQDSAEAYMWFTLAAEGGHRRSKDLLFMLETDLTASQMARAKRRAKEWKRTRQEQP